MEGGVDASHIYNMCIDLALALDVLCCLLDYIFFSRHHFRCVSCLAVDEESILRAHTALPSPTHPSDHIALVANIEFLHE